MAAVYRKCLAFLGLLLPMAAILIHFHLECLREREELRVNKFNFHYQPNQTDCKAEIQFFKTESKLVSVHLGLEFTLLQWLPCSVVKTLTFLGGGNMMAGFETDNHNLTIYDARKNNPGNFTSKGFTLFTLNKKPETINWRYSSKDVYLFHEQMNPVLKELYPQTKRIEWFGNVVRGGDQVTDLPRSSRAHLDSHQDDEERVKFYQHYDLPSGPMGNRTDAGALLGLLDTEHEKLGVMLGVWKPLSPSQICDYPLAVMDARTFEPDNQILNYLHINMIALTYNNLNGGVTFNPNQKWYYYSRQTPMEVLIFHHYSKGKWLVNPHTSFLNKNCPKGTESEERISVEFRVGLYF